jgi:catechol 2,3-dioxygenase-like lactoylglutathione lyase family enzyme
MVCRLIAVAVDCLDPERVSAFWARVLGQDVGQRWQDPHGVVYVELDCKPLGFGRPVLMFQQVQEPRSAKNRVHLDVVVAPGGDAAAQEVARLVELGATVIADEDGLPWAVLADPEGNEFCLRSGPRRTLPPEQADPVTAAEQRSSPSPVLAEATGGG